MASYWGYGVPAAVLGALGSGEEQRRQALAKQELDSLNQYRMLQIAIQQRQLEESKRQHDLQYGEASYTDPATGQTYKAPRSLLPAVLQMAGARERELDPTELGALGTIRERLTIPKVGSLAELESTATKQAFPQFAKEISPLTVDLPQDLRLPRSSVEKVFTEAGQQRKDLLSQERKDTQAQANALYRQVYQLARSQGQPHELADLIAIQSATQAHGIPPEREAFQGEPRPERETKMSVEDEFLKALQKDPVSRSPYEKSVIQQYTQGRDRNETLVGLAIRAEQGDQSAKRALDIYRNADSRSRESAFAQSMQILTQARTIRSQERGRLGQYLSDPAQEESEIRRIATQLAQGSGDATVVSIVQAMTTPVGTLPTPPPATPRPAVPAPRPSAPSAPTAVGGQETLSRRDARYSAAKQRGLTDEQIQTKFNLRLVD